MGKTSKQSRIYVAGHTGMLGSALLQRFKKEGFTRLFTKTHTQLDLTDQKKVLSFFKEYNPEYIFMAAGIGGGVTANINHPAEFIYNNIQIQNNIIEAAYSVKVKRLFFFACACIYPRDCPQPMKEEYLLTSPLESTSEAFAMAKICGIKMCHAYNRQYNTDFISLIPSNLYGHGDDFNLETSHVVSALIRKFYEAKINNKESVVILGSGKPQRDFLFVDDLVDACLFLFPKSNLPEVINIGSGRGVSIHQLAELVKKVTGFKGELKFDTAKPDGTPRKILDSSRLNSLGWKAKKDILYGIEETYKWFLQSKK